VMSAGISGWLARRLPTASDPAVTLRRE
jgi:hypothetical protein